MSDTWRERVATILEIIARDRLPNPHDLDVALDAIECEVSELVEAARRDEREANAALIDCGCDNRDAVLARLESRGERYAAYLCQQGSACCALEAATIRARGDA
jgi:hypothetical protein